MNPGNALINLRTYNNQVKFDGMTFFALIN